MPWVTIQLVKVTPPAATATTVLEPAPAVQSQGEQKDAQNEGRMTMAALRRKRMGTTRRLTLRMRTREKRSRME